MKRYILLVIAFTAQTNFAQSIFPTDGNNVGIGTISPTNSLTIRKTPDQNSAHIYFGEPLAVSGQPSASLCFGGSGIQNSGFTWVPSNTGEGKLHLSFGGQDNGIKNPIKMTFQSNGNVGIGTTAPSAKLETINTIAGITSFKSIGTNGYLLVDNVGSGENYYSANKFQEFQINGVPKMRINLEGNVGIGTTAPKQKLTIVGNQNAVDQGGPTNGQNSTAILRIQSSPGGAGEVLDFGMNIKSYGWIQPQDFNDPNAFYNLILNAKGGNVGIGTVTPDTKLAVNGTIHSKEVKVDMLGWPDYVFKKEYNLPTLEEVEKHINEKGHLENIPSEEEVLKNGINLGEMNAKLLQKMEEMTLYMIEMKKDIAILKEENKVLKAKK